jgi:hypothetical protein
MLGYSLLIPAGCSRSTAACGQQECVARRGPIAAAHDGSGRNNFPHKWSNRDPVAKAHRRSKCGRCAKKPNTGWATGTGHSDALLAPDVWALDVPRGSGIHTLHSDRPCSISLQFRKIISVFIAWSLFIHATSFMYQFGIYHNI